jgi:hypothetical protein
MPLDRPRQTAAQLLSITPETVSPADQEDARRERMITKILEQLSQDAELRARVRSHLKKTGRPDKTGPRGVLSDAAIYHFVELERELRRCKLVEAFKLVAQSSGLTEESVKTKYYRGKRMA